MKRCHPAWLAEQAGWRGRWAAVADHLSEPLALPCFLGYAQILIY
jgi:hypothetical protein